MNIIKNWLKRRKEKQAEECQRIDEKLMKAGYMCPDYKIHEYGELSDWINGVKYATCKNCGKTTGMLALSKGIN